MEIREVVEVVMECFITNRRFRLSLVSCERHPQHATVKTAARTCVVLGFYGDALQNATKCEIQLSPIKVSAVFVCSAACLDSVSAGV